jgi:hypothetical protein
MTLDEMERELIAETAKAALAAEAEQDAFVAAAADGKLSKNETAEGMAKFGLPFESLKTQGAELQKRREDKRIYDRLAPAQTEHTELRKTLENQYAHRDAVLKPLDAEILDTQHELNVRQSEFTAAAYAKNRLIDGCRKPSLLVAKTKNLAQTDEIAAQLVLLTRELDLTERSRGETAMNNGRDYAAGHNATDTAEQVEYFDAKIADLKQQIVANHDAAVALNAEAEQILEGMARP